MTKMGNSKKQYLIITIVGLIIIGGIVATFFFHGNTEKGRDDKKRTESNEESFTTSLLPDYYSMTGVGSSVTGSGQMWSHTDYDDIEIFKTIQEFDELIEKGDFESVYDNILPESLDVVDISKEEFVKQNTQAKEHIKGQYFSFEAPFDSNKEYTEEEFNDTLQNFLNITKPYSVGDKVIVVISAGEVLSPQKTILLDVKTDTFYLAPQTYSLVSTYEQSDFFEHTNTSYSLYLTKGFITTYCSDASDTSLCVKEYLCAGKSDISTPIDFEIVMDNGEKYTYSSCNYLSQKELRSLKAVNISEINVKNNYIEQLEEHTDSYSVREIPDFIDLQEKELN